MQAPPANIGTVVQAPRALFRFGPDAAPVDRPQVPAHQMGPELLRRVWGRCCIPTLGPQGTMIYEEPEVLRARDAIDTIGAVPHTECVFAQPPAWVRDVRDIR